MIQASRNELDDNDNDDPYAPRSRPDNTPRSSPDNTPRSRPDNTLVGLVDETGRHGVSFVLVSR